MSSHEGIPFSVGRDLWACVTDRGQGLQKPLSRRNATQNVRFCGDCTLGMRLVAHFRLGFRQASVQSTDSRTFCVALVRQGSAPGMPVFTSRVK